MVDIVVGFLVLVHFPLLCRHGIGPGTHIVHHLRHFIASGRIHEGLQFKSCRIVPFTLAVASVKVGRIRIPLHLRPDHPHRIRFLR